MILLNQILQENVIYIRQINRLKCDFWAKALHTNPKPSIPELFATLSNQNNAEVLLKPSLEAFLGLNSLRGKFIDSFFYGNSTNENYMTYDDVYQYLMKYIKISEELTPEFERKSLEDCLRTVLRAEQNFFEQLELKKRSLINSFERPAELFSFLRILFEDISSFSVRNKMKIMDFQKANIKLRVNHNFQVLSASDISYLQNYFHLNCDSGISYEEFIFMFCDYVSLQTHLQDSLHEQVKRVSGESFLPMNFVPASMRLNFGNFKEDRESKEGAALGLKALLLKGVTAKATESDAVWLRPQAELYQHLSTDEDSKDLPPNYILLQPESAKERVVQNQSGNMILNTSGQNLHTSLRPSEHGLQDQSRLSGYRHLSQMSHPQINIHQHSLDLLNNSHFEPAVVPQTPKKDSTSDLGRAVLQNSVLADESDHLSVLDKTIRENILEFRY